VFLNYDFKRTTKKEPTNKAKPTAFPRPTPKNILFLLLV
jgi:hypothetical protein